MRTARQKTTEKGLVMLHKDDNSHVGDNMRYAHSTRLRTRVFKSVDEAKKYAEKHTKITDPDEDPSERWQRDRHGWYWDAGYVGWDIEPVRITKVKR